MLNRILRYTEQGLRWEADPRHAELLIKALALEDAKKGVCTPCVKPKDPEDLEEQEEIRQLDDPDGYSNPELDFKNSCMGIIRTLHGENDSNKNKHANKGLLSQ